MCVTSLTTSPQHHLVAKFPFRFCMVLPLISASYSYMPFISLSSMLHMISIFLLIVKKGLVSGLVLLSIVVILSPTWYLMQKPSKSSIEVLSGPGLLKTPIKGLFMLEGRKIISLTPNPPNIQLQCQMMRSQLNQLPLLSTSNQGTMMVQPQASLCQNSTLMTLLEGPFYYLLETMERD